MAHMCEAAPRIAAKVLLTATTTSATSTTTDLVTMGNSSTNNDGHHHLPRMIKEIVECSSSNSMRGVAVSSIRIPRCFLMCRKRVLIQGGDAASAAAAEHFGTQEATQPDVEGGVDRSTVYVHSARERIFDLVHRYYFYHFVETTVVGRNRRQLFPTGLCFALTRNECWRRLFFSQKKKKQSEEKKEAEELFSLFNTDRVVTTCRQLFGAMDQYYYSCYRTDDSAAAGTTTTTTARDVQQQEVAVADDDGESNVFITEHVVAHFDCPLQIRRRSCAAAVDSSRKENLLNYVVDDAAADVQRRRSKKRVDGGDIHLLSNRKKSTATGKKATMPPDDSAAQSNQQATTVTSIVNRLIHSSTNTAAGAGANTGTLNNSVNKKAQNKTRTAKMTTPRMPLLERAVRRRGQHRSVEDEEKHDVSGRTNKRKETTTFFTNTSKKATATATAAATSGWIVDEEEQEEKEHRWEGGAIIGEKKKQQNNNDETFLFLSKHRESDSSTSSSSTRRTDRVRRRFLSELTARTACAVGQGLGLITQVSRMFSSSSSSSLSSPPPSFSLDSRAFSLIHDKKHNLLDNMMMRKPAPQPLMNTKLLESASILLHGRELIDLFDRTVVVHGRRGFSTSFSSSAASSSSSSSPTLLLSSELRRILLRPQFLREAFQYWNGRLQQKLFTFRDGEDAKAILNNNKKKRRSKEEEEGGAAVCLQNVVYLRWMRETALPPTVLIDACASACATTATATALASAASTPATTHHNNHHHHPTETLLQQQRQQQTPPPSKTPTQKKYEEAADKLTLKVQQHQHDQQQQLENNNAQPPGNNNNKRGGPPMFQPMAVTGASQQGTVATGTGTTTTPDYSSVESVQKEAKEIIAELQRQHQRLQQQRDNMRHIRKEKENQIEKEKQQQQQQQQQTADLSPTAAGEQEHQQRSVAVVLKEKEVEERIAHLRDHMAASAVRHTDVTLPTLKQDLQTSLDRYSDEILKPQLTHREQGDDTTITATNSSSSGSMSLAALRDKVSSLRGELESLTLPLPRSDPTVHNDVAMMRRIAAKLEGRSRGSTEEEEEEEEEEGGEPGLMLREGEEEERRRPASVGGVARATTRKEDRQERDEVLDIIMLSNARGDGRARELALELQSAAEHLVCGHYGDVNVSEVYKQQKELMQQYHQTSTTTTTDVLGILDVDVEKKNDEDDDDDDEAARSKTAEQRRLQYEQAQQFQRLAHSVFSRIEEENDMLHQRRLQQQLRLVGGGGGGGHGRNTAGKQNAPTNINPLNIDQWKIVVCDIVNARVSTPHQGSAHGVAEDPPPFSLSAVLRWYKITKKKKSTTTAKKSSRSENLNRTIYDKPSSSSQVITKKRLMPTGLITSMPKANVVKAGGGGKGPLTARNKNIYPSSATSSSSTSVTDTLGLEELPSSSSDSSKHGGSSNSNCTMFPLSFQQQSLDNRQEYRSNSILRSFFAGETDAEAQLMRNIHKKVVVDNNYYMLTWEGCSASGNEHNKKNTVIDDDGQSVVWVQAALHAD